MTREEIQELWRRDLTEFYLRNPLWRTNYHLNTTQGMDHFQRFLEYHRGRVESLGVTYRQWLRAVRPMRESRPFRGQFVDFLRWEFWSSWPRLKVMPGQADFESLF